MGRGFWRSFRVGAAILLLLVLATAQGAEGKALEPREISAAERAAVELAIAYLQGGPDAWLPRLAKEAPLGRLPPAAARAEIAARLGPADGSNWQLFTPGPSFDADVALFGIEYASGLDETVTLHLVDEGGWKISDIRTSVDKFEPRAAAWRAAAAEVATGPAVEDESAGLFPAPVRWRLGGCLLGLFLGAAGSILLLRKGKRTAAIATAAGALLLAVGLGAWGIVLLSTPGSPPPLAAPAIPAVSFVRLGSLAPLHTALAAGSDPAEIDRLLAVPESDPVLRDVHDLWKAQYLFTKADLAAIEAVLRRFPERSGYPAVDLLRARLSFRRLQREGTGKLYDRAIGNGLDHDGLRLESVFAQALTDDNQGAEVSITLMVEMGSRLAQAWYSVAQIAIAEDRMDDAEHLLRAGWQLEPAPRDELFGEPLLAYLVARPRLFPLFQLGSPEEPRVLPIGRRTPLLLPAGARAATCGQSLRLALNNAELLVAGGALLAPVEAVAEDAGAWSRHAEAKALEALPALTASAAAGETLPPRRLRLAEQAAGALAAQNRWEELIALTESVAVHVEDAPSGLVRLRAHALRRVGRTEGARQLLLRLAGSDIASRRTAPGTLFELAELFAAEGEFDTAIKLSKKADAQLPTPRGERRRRQLELDKQLVASYASYRSKHFDVRYPIATGETYARGVSIVLEEERRRLQRWIPNPGSELIEVHLFPLQEFFSTFGSENVVGVYDGKVRVPFADLQSLDPALVEILSHELAHAMIAGATKDQAPHWFQEGLAEHVEMGVGRINPLPDLARTGRALSFPTLEPILSGFAEPQLVDLGYSEAAWTLQFLEARFGLKSIHGMLNAYAAGRTTEAAVQQVTGLTPADLDRALWKWGTTEAPQARNLEVRRYDEAYASKLAREEGRSGGVTSDGAEAIPAEGRERDDQLLDGREEELSRRMKAWYERYQTRTVRVKQALQPIVDAYRPGAQPITAQICIPLAVEANRVLGELPLWTSPDSNVNRLLRSGYQTLVEAGKACQEGRGTDAKALLGRASARFNEAGRYLEPYGMKP
jgi:tetratricopeptide (TPR) repeat protein